ncbi:MAG: DNA adenine methylase [Candidatus Heimdallarchaeota archaeon]|nr:MAG: DNA adenine methylase [Candidatus Heimdallarchaeota archaeon]
MRMQVSFPQTRYQGSKLKLLNWFHPIFRKIDFDTALDAFGGTGAVSYMLKIMGKEITYNDLLTSNWYIGKALIENNSKKLDPSKIESLFHRKNGYNYRTTIQDQFKGIYYTNAEDKLLDIVVQNISYLEDQYEKSLAFFVLFQACIQKRPFNLFHRKNLYLRLNNVKRSFGNKKTWDTPFLELMLRALKEGNQAIYDNSRVNKAINFAIQDVPIPDEGYDLVYLDPPYISLKGVGVDYRDYYHFLEGICDYDKWEDLIDRDSKHKRLKLIKNDWNDPKQILKAFEESISKFQDSKLVISYRDPGIPSIEALKNILFNYKEDVSLFIKDYKYALTSKEKKVKEVLIFADNP